MAQEIVRHVWCDVHMQEHEQRVEGRTVTISLDLRVPKQVDLCEEHYVEIVQPLMVLMEDAGRPAELDSRMKDRLRKAEKRGNPVLFDVEGSESSKPEVLYCPVSGCTYSAKTRGSIRAHVEATHNSTLSDEETRNGISIEGQPLTHECPECQTRFTAGTALGAHRRHVHGVAGTSVSSKRDQAIKKTAAKAPSKTSKAKKSA